jgi:microsomal epoxide hydrolase
MSAVTGNKVLKPFTIDVPESILTDLAERLGRTRLPDGKGFDPWRDGTPSTYVKELVAHWQGSFDWRLQEAEPNRFTQRRGMVD